MNNAIKWLKGFLCKNPRHDLGYTGDDITCTSDKKVILELDNEKEIILLRNHFQQLEAIFHSTLEGIEARIAAVEEELKDG